MNELRAQVLEFIEVAIVELRGVAQPRDVAELRELAMDAEDAETAEQLASIQQQAENLRAFCERRKMSSVKSPTIPPSGRRQV